MICDLSSKIICFKTASNNTYVFVLSRLPILEFFFVNDCSKIWWLMILKKTTFSCPHTLRIRLVIWNLNYGFWLSGFHHQNKKMMRENFLRRKNSKISAFCTELIMRKFCKNEKIPRCEKCAIWTQIQSKNCVQHIFSI